MSNKKSVYVSGIGEVYIYKRKRMKTIRLRVNHDGDVVLSVPRWIMLKQAVDFAKTKKDWILEEKLKNSSNKLQDGMVFGGNMKLRIVPTGKSRPNSKLSGKTLSLSIPSEYNEAKSQEFIKKKVNEVLKSQAEKILLPRLRSLADKYDIFYKSAGVAVLKSRWGSCDSKANIKLNAYLLQLPDGLIDYVLLHELNHVKHMNHSQAFWRDLKGMCQNAEQHKRTIRSHNPRLETFIP